MKPLSRIVVPVDRTAQSLRALWPARVIADFVGADLVAASVVAKLRDREPAEAELGARVDATGVPVSETVVTVSGYTVAEGLDAVTHGPGVLVVVATVGHSRTLAFTGSVAEELVHARAEEPTLLVGPLVDVASFDLSGPMVVCRDPERASPRAEELSGRFARQLVMNQVVLSVQPADRAGNRARAGTAAADPAGSPGPVVRHGDDPAATVVAFADDVGASIIAAGTHRRDALSRMTSGSVAIRTVAEAHCPVLAVPEGS